MQPPYVQRDTAWLIGAAAMGLTNSDALMLWANVTVLLVPPGAQIAIMGWLLKPELDKIPGYSQCLIEALQTGNCYTTREPA